MVTQILTTILTIVITSIIAFYFTTRSNIKRFNMEINEAFEVHKKIYHESSVYTVIDKVMEKHTDNCEALNCLPEIKESQVVMKGALIFLVTKAGGNPGDLKLFE